MKSAGKILLFISGLVALFAFSSYFFFLPKMAGSDQTSLRDLKNDFASYLKQREPHAPFLEIEHSWPLIDELAKPENFLPHYDRYDLDQVQALYEFSTTCKLPLTLKDANLKKAFIWQTYICKKGKLPAEFFNLPPYIHPSGQSFSYLGKKEGLEVPEKYMTWIENIRANGRISSYFSANDWVHLALIAQQSDFVFLDRYVLVRKEFGSFNYRYVAYDIRNAEEYFSQTKPYFFVSFEKGKLANCIENLQKGCWTANMQYESGSRRALSMAMLAAMTVSALLFLALAIAAVIKNNEIKNDRNFIMRTLSHELRTPIAALSLDVESLRKLFNSVDDESQKALLRVFNNVGRLKALVHGSEKYLSADAGTLKKSNSGQEINLAASVAQLIESQNLNVTAEIPDSINVFGNEHWLQLCVQNLIQNALVHGKPPIVVKAGRERNRIFLDVCDHGVIQKDFASLVKPFSKGSASEGLGLGLEIAQKAASLTFAELTLLKTPFTTFRLTWRSK